MKRLLLLFGLVSCWITAQGQYCTTGLYSSGCSFGDEIDDFILGSFMDTATGCTGTGAYNDFTSKTVTVTQTLPQILEVTSNYSGQTLKIFVDYNNDLDFDDPGEEVYVSPTTYGAASGPLQDTLIWPSGSPVGTFRMRVRDGWLNTTFDACSSVGYGEIHDYTLVVNPNTVGNCSSSFADFDIDSISGTAAKISWIPGAANSSFFLEYGPQGFVPGSPAGTKITGSYPGSQPPLVLTGLTPTTAYDVYFGEICNSGADSIYFALPQDFTTTVTCPAPTGLADSGTTGSTADIVWNTVIGTDFKVEWGPVGFVQGTGTSVTVSDTTGYQITGLNPLSSYDVYVGDSCSPTDQSAYAGPITITTGCSGSLSGNYTLNPGQAYSSTNFISFSQLQLAFELCGISGPVTIDVTPGALFNEQIFFPEVAGASATNTITINGNGATLSYLSTSSTDRATLSLMGTDYLTIDSLTIQALGTASGEYGMTIRITDSAMHNTVRNCMLVSDTSSTSSNFANFAINGINNTFPTSTSGPSGDYNLIENNTIIGGYYGLICTGQSTDSANGNVLRNNTIRDYRYYGLYAYYNSGITIEGNDISRPYRTNLTSSYGMYMYGVTSGSVIKNRIHDPFAQDTSVTSSAYGFYASQFVGTPSNPCLIANNMIYNMRSNGTVYGMYTNSGTNTNYLHNSVIINNPMSSATGVTRGIYAPGTYDNCSFENNLIYLDRGGSGTKYVFYLNGALTPTTTVDHNAYYASDATTFDFGYSGGTISTFGEWQVSTGLDSNSFFVNPFLTNASAGNFTPQSAVIDGLGADYTSIVATDIDGNTRTTPVDPGALEFTGAACTGPNGVNISSVSVTNATISWNTNTTPFTIEWGPVGFRQASITPNVINVSSGGTSATLSGLTQNTCYDYYIIQNCTSSIPGAPPEIGPLQVCTDCATPGLSGTYTIGGSAGPNNFATLDSAVSVLNSCGILGPVVFNMNGGTHGAIVLENVSGSNATNTITFNGSLAGDSIIATGTTAAIDINGSKYVNINNIYARNTGGLYVIWLHEGAQHINIDNCVLEGDRTGTASTAVVGASTSATSIYGTGYSAEHINVTNCNLAGNYIGVLFNGTSSTSWSSNFNVDNCEFEDQYYYGIRSYYIDSASYTNNFIGELRSSFSYGIYAYYNEFITVTGNIVEKAGNYGMYSYYTNRTNGSASTVSVIANNMINADGNYGLYAYGNSYTNIYNNTFDGNTYGLYLSGSTFTPFSDLDVRNNLITNDGTGAAMFVGTEPDTNFTLDYNAYYTAGATLVSHGTGYATLAAYQTGEPSYNANSVSGDPIYVSATDLHVLGSTVNDVGDNSVGITVDVDGDSRPASGSTTVDIGADEFTPVADDIAIINGMFLKVGKCLGQNDTVMLQVQNVIGSTKNFATNALTAHYSVTGPVNTTGSVTVNSGTLAPNDTLDILGFPVDLSIPGVYSLEAWIDPNSTNLTDLNDTLVGSTSITIYPDWEVSPDTIVVISNMTDTVELKASSPFFGGADFFITEVCHFKTSTGTPVGGFPSWLAADDYIEITGVPGSDLGGFTLEQWSTTSLYNSYTFPQGTILGPNGTAIIAVGTAIGSTPSPSDFYYHGDVSTGFSSGSSAGRILKDPSGVIIDAVGYGPSSYTFPLSSGADNNHWSGGQPSSTSTCGIRLEGADVNSGTNWVSSGTSAQDPNTVNANVQVPSPGSVQGFTWSLNGSVIDTMPTIVVGPYAGGGVYNYIATYNSPCGVFTDTVTVVVNLPGVCPTPTNLSGNAVACDSVIFSWNSAADSALVSYVISGGTPAAANLVIGDSSFAAVGLTASTDYDFYVANICGSDTSMVAGPITVNTGTNGAPVADFTASPQMGTFQVNFDASASTGARATYDWEFGDGNIDSGMVVSHTYAAGGSYSVKLTVTNACGVHDTTITVADVSLAENSLSRNMRFFPNPVNDELNLELAHDNRGAINIRIMDMSGKEMIRLSDDKLTEKMESTIDVSRLAKGVYMLEVSDDEFSAVRRFIKD